MRPPSRAPLRRGALWTLVLAAAGSASAQTILGPSKCVTCHDHARQAEHWQKLEPAEQKGRAHFDTLKQLDGAKAQGFAKAIGLADPYDVKGDCVKCHATVFRGDANAGVSCESCHGGASGYLDLHQQKGAYAQAVAAGMRDLREKPAVIGRMCVECHTTADKRLAAAGHPTGEAFDPGVAMQKLVHWNATYNYALVTAAGRSLAATRLAGLKGAAPAAAPAAAAEPQAAAPRVAAAPAAAPAAPTAAASAPWDWNQPVRELPKDYVPEPVPAAAPAAAAASPVSAPPARPARRLPAPPEPAVPPSLAEDVSIPAGAPGGAAAPLSAAVEPAPAAPAPGAASAEKAKEAQLAELRGRGVRLLEKLLRSGARAKEAPAPPRPGEFAGPDGELLRLQDEVLVLAIEALRRPD